jgi:hypothetical protein
MLLSWSSGLARMRDMIVLWCMAKAPEDVPGTAKYRLFILFGYAFNDDPNDMTTGKTAMAINGNRIDPLMQVHEAVHMALYSSCRHDEDPHKFELWLFTTIKGQQIKSAGNPISRPLITRRPSADVLDNLDQR